MSSENNIPKQPALSNELVEVPKGWQIKKLGEVGEIVSGGTPSTKVAEYWNGKISWITPADLSGYNEKIILQGRKSISVNGLKNSSARLIPKGSILFSSRAPIGYVVIAGNEVCTNQGFKSIVPNKSILSDYLFYFLKASKQEAEKVASGTTFKEISLKAFSQLEIPLPPLPEQLAIVSKIEELFSEMDKGVESLKTAQQQLKVYRQSLLKWAFEGRLTSTSLSGRQTFPTVVEPGAVISTALNALDHAVVEHEPVVERSRNHRHEAETTTSIAAEGKEKYGIQNELPEGWRWKTIEEVCEMKAGFFVKAPDIYENFKDGLFPCYGGNGLRGYVKSSTHEGTFALIGRQGALCGNVHLVNGKFHATEHAVVVKANEGIDIKWFYYKLVSMKLNQYSSGVAQPGLSVNKLLPLKLTVPPIKEQQLIVDELESKLTVCDKIEETINKGLQQSEALRQSILKKAFEGKLV